MTKTHRFCNTQPIKSAALLRIQLRITPVILGNTPLDPKFCHLNVVQGKWQELLRLEERYKKKHEKYSKALEWLTWLKACSSGLSIASGISSVVTLSTLIGLSISVSLGAISLAGASVSGVAMALTKKYQKKLTKVTKLADIIMSALAVFETSVSKVLNNVKVDEQEFTMLQTLQLGVLNEQASVYYKIEAEMRTQLQKSQRPQEAHKRCLVTCMLFPVCYLMCYHSVKNG